MTDDAGGGLESLSVAQLLARLTTGTEAAVRAVEAAAPDIEAAVDGMVTGWRAGGRLIYVGAGTSGRIGLLDAAECGPTFGIPPERVRAILAGGSEAMHAAVEGAEDDEADARRRIDALCLTGNDLVVGLSASGTTPFTVAAIEHAAAAGARTVAITGVRDSRLARAAAGAIVLDVGEELVLGSTRLAAGTAQKLACNALSTAAFVRLGRVRGREMVAVRPTNAKLRRRAVDILVRHLATDRSRAASLLQSADDDLPCALVMGETGMRPADARAALDAAGGDIPRALALAERKTMTPLAVNWLIVALYFVATLWLGERVGRGKGSVDDYFLAGRRMPWWSTALSIVGTETSTLTFVGVPAIAFGGDLRFLQVAAGYVIGRFIVAWLLVPAYFAGNVSTAYELLAQRFGGGVQKIASVVFLVSRCLADGVRLFATALVLQALLPMPMTVAVVAVIGITLVYTLRGGLRAVIWNDAVQLIVYLGGACVAAGLLVARIPGGWEAASATLSAAGKLRVLDMSWSWVDPYTFWAGVLGGAALTTATHGTDQMFVQRLLACGSVRDSRRAVVASGFIVFLQMALFLWIGSLLFVYYQGGAALPEGTPADQIFPLFIAREMPVGLGGLVIAAVFAAAMSTLSSSMSSLASSTVLDLGVRGSDEAGTLRRSHRATAGWALVLAAVAFMARGWGSVLEAGLTITSITFGGVLGVFLLGLTTREMSSRSVAVALAAGIGVSLVTQQAGWLAWTWLTPLGALVTWTLGIAASRTRVTA